MRRPIVLLVCGLFLLAGLIIVPPGAGQGLNQPPTANAGNDVGVLIDQTFTISGSRSSDPDGDGITYSWDFDRNDGISQDSTGMNVNHNYSRAGSYTVTLTVDDGSLTDTDTLLADVTGNYTEYPPIAVIKEPANGAVVNATELIDFDGTWSSDKNYGGNLTAYQWDFGDDSKANGSKVRHRYQTVGVYNVVLTVTDAANQTGAAQVTIIVQTVPGAGVPGVPGPGIRPNATAHCWDLTTLNEGPMYNFHELLCASYSHDDDSAGDSGGIRAWSWDFNISDGMSILNPDANTSVVLWLYNDSANYTATLVVTDDDPIPKHNFTQFPLVVDAHPPPFVDAGPDQAVDDGAIVTLIGKAKPPEGPVFSGDKASNFAWDWDGDGVWDYESNTTARTTHVYDVPGQPKNATVFTAVFRACLHEGELCAEDRANIIVRAGPNLLPLADPGPLRAGFAGEPVRFEGKGQDPDGIVIRYEWDFASDGVIDWTSSTSGVASWTYDDAGSYLAKFYVTDDSSARVEAQVAVDVRVNRQPVAIAGDDVETAINQVVQFDGTGSSDPDGDALRYSWDFDDRDGISTDSDAPRPTFTYRAAGISTVTLRVMDPHIQNSVSDPSELLVRVVLQYGVAWGQPRLEVSGVPGEIIPVNLNVKNTGDGPDIINVRTSGQNVNWASLSSTRIEISGGEEVPVTLQIVIPQTAVGKVDEARLTVTAISEGDPQITADMSVTVLVKEVHSLQLVLKALSQKGAAGEKLRNTAALKNVGNVKESAKVRFEGDAGKWLRATPATATLKPGQEITLVLEITIPADAKAGNHDVTVIADGPGGVGKTVQTLTIQVTGGTFSLVPGFELLVALVAVLGAAALAGRRARVTS